MRFSSFVSPAFVAIALVAGCSTSTPVANPTSSDQNIQKGTVTLEIQSDALNKSIEVKDVADGATLESVMRSIDEIEIGLSGSGITAFVNRIGKVETSSSEGWTFRVDGEWANQGIGATKLSPPTTVRWQYGTMEEALGNDQAESAEPESEAGESSSGE